MVRIPTFLFFSTTRIRGPTPLILVFPLHGLRSLRRGLCLSSLPVWDRRERKGGRSEYGPEEVGLGQTCVSRLLEPFTSLVKSNSTSMFPRLSFVPVRVIESRSLLDRHNLFYIFEFRRSPSCERSIYPVDRIRREKDK